MKHLIFYSVIFCIQFSTKAQKDYTTLVNPFIGTGGHGHTYPGASMPFGMMQLSPDTRMADWDGSSGYHYSDSLIYGFSHSHLSGVGIPDYCDLLFMPFMGEVEWNKEDYRSAFSHNNEKASPGYYEVMLDKHNIKTQLTTSTRSGMHQYSFPANTNTASILIDLSHRDETLDAFIEQINKYELRGYRRSKSWAQNQMFFFHIRFEQPIGSMEMFDASSVNTGDHKKKIVKTALKFVLPGNNILRCKVGISGVSMEGARLNLNSEIKDWNFESVRYKAKAAWNKELSKIDIKGGTKDQQINFYTAMYHTFLAPNIYQDVDGKFRSTDLKVHKNEGFTNYSVFSLWDTYRAYNPLMTIINQKRMSDWIKTFLVQYKYGGMLPVWELSGNETFCMIGYHSVPVIVDAYQKGIRGFDTKLALKAMRNYAESNRFGLDVYRDLGYVSNDKEHESVSKTLEYAYDDWCIAQYAKMLGVDSVYKKYLRRAQYYKNVFDPQTRHMRGKIQGMWYSPFDPNEINNFFTEGNSWQYSFAVPQDIQTLIKLHGGKQAFTAKLNELFTTSSKTTGRDQSDVTGLIGQYAHGNEPSHHMAYLFSYVGMPWRTQELIHQINTEFYKNDPDGLIGNEDCGQMSAWFVLSSMGFYPVCPGSGEYVLGTPLFDEATINLENGKKFTVKANRKTPSSKYVKETKLNARLHNKNYLLHSDVIKGGLFEFTLTETPDKIWGSVENVLPTSRINGQQIIPVPYFDIRNNKFKDQISVSIKNIDSKTEIYYSFNPTDTPSKYTGPFMLNESSTIYAFAHDGNEMSQIISQQFHKVPSDKSITVLSNVNAMYTGGGPEALIDGIVGSSNWRTGDWQSYYGQHFEAVIDLHQTKPVKYIGIHVLQDPSPWILYPKELIVYSSEDGKNFTEIKRIGNNKDQKIESIEVMEMGEEVEVKTRYIKVKAINAGKLPAWHESAGNPSHLFIDEIIVR